MSIAWWTRVRAVFRKEWIDTWKDRRGTQSALMFAMLGPFVVLMLLQSMIAKSRDESMPKIALVGAALWPDLVTQLGTDFVVSQELNRDRAMHQLASNQVDLVLAIPQNKESIGAQLSAGRTIVLQVATQSARSKSQQALVELRSRLNAFNDSATQMRLLAHGVSPTQLRAIGLTVEEHGPSARFQTLTQTMVLMLLMGAFFAGMNVAIDTTAGERERESLEVLLAQATNPMPLLFGKYLVVLSFASIGSLLTVALLCGGLSQLALYQLPLKLDLAWMTWLQIWAALWPFAVLMSALQMTFSLFARNYKEAQIYLTLLAFLPAGMSLPFAEQLPKGWPIPVLQETQWLQALLRGGELPWWQWGSLLTVVLGIVALLLMVCGRALRHERMLAAS